MRGAQPDAECARCGARFPPSFEGGLMTCKSCGLVFAPHEVQRPYRHGELAGPRPASDDFLDPIQESLGDGVFLAITAQRFEVSKRHDPSVVIAVLGLGAVLASAAPWALLGALSATLVLLRSRSTFTVEGDTATVRRRPFPFDSAATFRVADVTSFAVVPRPGMSPLFDVHAELRDGRTIPLVHSVGKRTGDGLVRWLTVRLANAPAVG